MSQEQPTYEAARIVAPLVETHFADHHGDAVSRGEEDLAPRPDAETIRAIVDASFWSSFRREEGHFPKISSRLWLRSKCRSRFCLKPDSIW